MNSVTSPKKYDTKNKLVDKMKSSRVKTKGRITMLAELQKKYRLTTGRKVKFENHEKQNQQIFS